MTDVLLEIGTEELPPHAVSSGERQLRSGAVEAFAEHRIPYTSIESFATPRRLALLVRGVPERQDPATEERRGPPVARSFLDDGSFAPAAVGFARANEVAPEDLVRKETDGGEYLYAVFERPGRDTADVLPNLCSDLVEGLSFPKTMRWDASGVRFPRPIRWLVALQGPEVLPVRIGPLEAGRHSVGHRVFHPGPLEIPDAAAYPELLRAARVEVDRSIRRDAVRAGAEEAAAAAGGRALISPGNLDEVTDLVEEPVPLTGRFEERYLEVPRPVLETAMQSHQRYFPVEGPDGALQAAFVCVSNADPGNAQTIIAGNERVLRARLEDAAFFFREDLKQGLAERTERLSEIVLHSELGTMRDKVVRVGSLLGPVVAWLGLDDADADAAFIASEVYKADLLSQMVYEFPELQGVMGREYALRDTDLREHAGDRIGAVADAIAEHYLPRAAGDELPRTAAGAALGIADRLDTLVGYVGVGAAPSGSEDPYALRRAASAVAQTLMAHGGRLPLAEALGAAWDGYHRAGVELAPRDEVVSVVLDLLVSRAEQLLERDEIDRLFIAAAKGAAPADLPDLADRARALQALHHQGKLHQLAVVHERAHNLSTGTAEGAVVDPDLLTDDAEQDLYGQLVAVEEIARERAAERDYTGTLEVLVPLGQVLGRFFEDVLVMAEDEGVRANRMGLLARTARVFQLVADFARIEPKLLLTE